MQKTNKVKQTNNFINAKIYTKNSDIFIIKILQAI